MNSRCQNADDGCSTYIHSQLGGRSTFAFWTAVLLLLTLTIGNLILLLTIIGTLQLGKGLANMELIPEEDAIKFYGSTDLDRIYTKNPNLEGFTDVPVSLTAFDSSFLLRLIRNGQAQHRLLMDKEGVSVRSVNAFEIKHPKNDAVIFTTHRPSYNMPMGADVLIAKGASSSRVSSPLRQPLTVHSDGKTFIRGAEGISMDATAIVLQSMYNIAVNSTETILEASSGIFLDMDKIPLSSSEFGLRTGAVQYKICVCMPQGTLFRIAIPRLYNAPKISCAHFSSKHDPCF